MKPLFIIIIAILIGVAICLGLGFLGIVPFTALSSMVSGWFSGLDLGSFLSNPLSILTAIGGVTGIIALYSKFTSMKNQAEAIKAQAQQQISQYSTALNGATSQLETATSSLTDANKTITSLNTAKSIAETQASTLQQQLDKLQNNFEVLKQQNAANFQAALPAGTTIIQPNGTTLTKVTETIVK